ncbi:MAG: hypothetical protein PVJ71_06300 [Lysobacterales bacterium]|jgi:hypothetical protein
MNDNLQDPARPDHQDAEPAAQATGIEHEPVKGSDVSRMAKNVGLFFASPFVALGYVIALPFVALYQFIKLAREARANKKAGK